MSPAPPPSIRGRLGRLLVGLAVVWGVLVGAAVWAVLRHEIHEMMDEGLLATSRALVGAVGADAERQAADAEARDADESPFVWQVLAADGTVQQRSPQAPVAPLVSAPQRGFVEDAAAQGSGDNAWRVVARPLADGRWLLVGQARAERLETALEVAGGTIAAALAVGLLGMAWLRWAVRRELRPLDDLKAALAAYDPLRDGNALPAPVRAELQPVHRAVEALGARLARRVEVERAFSAHAAHALRTPLAGIDAQLAVALREVPAALRPRLERLRGASARLAAVVSALLTLFRSGGEPRLQALDLRALLVRVPVEGLTIELQGSPQVLADPDLLAAALINLLENAQRHGARHVRMHAHAGGLRLDDDGPGVTPERRQALLAALRADVSGTLDDAAVDGALPGLGLALAQRVARAHGGRLELPVVERGFAVELGLTATDAAR